MGEAQETESTVAAPGTEQAEAEEQQPREAGKLPPTKKFKAKQGDYIVQCHIIEARDLKGRGFGDRSDPVVSVECMDRKKSSSIVKDCLSPVWDEVVSLEYHDVQPRQLEQEKVMLKVFDANVVRRNVLIGAFEFELGTVYMQKHHEVHRQWVALSDVTDKHEGIQGYLRVSIVVLGPDDEQFLHPDDEADADEKGLVSVLLPPRINAEGHSLHIKAYRVEDMPDMDNRSWRSKCDPYCKVEFAGVKLKSKARQGQNVDLVSQLDVPVMEPIMGSKIKLSVYDKDKTSSDDRVATFLFDYLAVKEDPIGPIWVNLYGAPEGQQSGVASKMNRGYVEGSTYRGRLLLEMNVGKTQDPEAGVSAIAMTKEVPREIDYALQFDLYEGADIASLGAAHIQLCVGNTVLASGKAKVKEGRCMWYQSFSNANPEDEDADPGRADDIIVRMPEDVLQCPDVIVYLCYSSNRISYLRFPFHELVSRGWSSPPKWHVLKEDKALDKLTDAQFPGTVLFSLRGGRLDCKPDEMPEENRPFLNNTQSDNIQLEVSIPSHESGQDPDQDQEQWQQVTGPTPTWGDAVITIEKAKNLPAADRNGLSDPYVKAKIGGQKAKTSVCKKTLNPSWNESFHFPKVHIDQPLTLKVVDRDTLRDTTLGEVEISMRTLSDQPPGRSFASQSWFLVSEKVADAQVFVRVEFSFDKTMSGDIPTEKLSLGKRIKNTFTGKVKAVQAAFSVRHFGEPTRRQFQLRAHIYQARGLVPADKSGLSDPYLVLRCAGKRRRTRHVLQTLSPQWYTTLTANVNLPVPLDLAPPIHLQLYDYDSISGDDVIGRVAVPCSQAFAHQQVNAGRMMPQWYEVLSPNGENKAGKMLAFFEFLTVDQTSRPVPSLFPESDNMWLHMAVLGLRDMKSSFGVHKTKVRVQVPGEKAHATRGSSRPTSRNPNFLEVLSIPVSIPRDPLFQPTVTVTVLDSMLAGLIKRLIGTADIPLRQFMQLARSATLLAHNDAEEAEHDREEEEREEWVRLVQHEQDKQQQRQRHESQSRRSVLAHANASAEEEVDMEAAGALLHSTTIHVPLQQDNQVALPDSTLHVGSLAHEEAEDEDEEEDESKPLLGGAAGDSDRPSVVVVREEEYDMDSDEKEMEEPPAYMKNRKSYDDELEDVITIRPFFEAELCTGSLVGNKVKQVGHFKGMLMLSASKEEGHGSMFRELLVPECLFVRVYVLRGHRLTSRDRNGACDPYLKLRLGNTKISTRSRRLHNTLEPGFFESFEIPVTMPGHSKLKLDVWDWDGIGDDLVGSTTIDVENRWFCKQWKSLERKPVEHRSLYNPSSSFPQGKLAMWVEVLSANEAKRTPMADIRPPPPEPYELRVIVWGVKDVPEHDHVTNQSDLYVTGQLDVPGVERQSTDLHFRAKSGTGNFNWRMKFPVQLPLNRTPRFRLAVWDKDYFSANDYIAEVNMSLRGLFARVRRSQRRVIAKKGGKEKFWIKGMRHPNRPDEDQGRIKVSFEIMPEAMAKQIPAGMGRGEPNTNPFLPPPEGRISWTLNPFFMLRQLLGNRCYAKFCGVFFCLIFGAFLVLLAPMIFSNAVVNVFF